ncbi:hypothetical protein [Corynebacterium sanguinis]|uniref:hypothetical protein n=1 Tax=Corynebacterium sanguinis TaxID=2594913 RepID=UPI0011A8673F|nr:hypothetical protein [Corynebacterium sanguinis]MCT1695481.1 hypothetical protein [Corynebacterium sanguinis]MCT1714889.1 hypothetical protein [Corynebacterium sanguinis]MCT2252853.1 hypothetical protein [Corynebacterium sanguinis]TVS23046.1 hypothetical protein EKI50_04750 [Corynebacterium sanguinis]
MTIFDGMTNATPWPIKSAPDPGCEQISARHFLPTSALRPTWAVLADARTHPRSIEYGAPAAARALALAVEHPESIIVGHSALAVYGLPHLVEGWDTTLVLPRAANATGDALSATITRRGCRDSEAWALIINGYPFRVANPAVATCGALKAIGGDELKSIQLVDAAMRHLSVTAGELRDAARYRVNGRWLEKILSQSSPLADSPKETEMRLLTVQIAQRFGLSLQQQMPLYSGSRLVTIFDLALVEPKIGLMYDGSHHWEYDQRQKDSLINLDATALGWTPLRFSSGTLPQLPERLSALLRANGFRG